MQVAITTTIDDIQVIIGFSKLTIDPIETNNKWIAYCKANNIYADLAQLSKQVELILISMQKSDENIEKKKSALEDLYKKCNEQSEIIKSIKKEFVEDNAVYFKPSKTDFVIDEDNVDLIRKFNSLKPGSFLKTNGEIIVDTRGMQYFVDENGYISMHTIEKLDEKLPHNFVSVLSEKQQERYDKQLFDAMDKDEQESFIQCQYNMAMESAKSLLLELQIRGNKNALELSRLQYEDEIEAINRKYIGNA